ncbi:MAG: hypothetical protein NT093_00405 [Candidatus Moranbacteria bacterium]|nr:hypothetical protein [Candidatus Moranbacteria bacterium]
MSDKYLNTLIVSGDKAERERFKKDVDTGHDDDYLSLYNLLPIPKELNEKRDIRTWCERNWGTPCDVSAEDRIETADELVYHLFGISSPPTLWLKTVSKKFPTLEFGIRYRDEYGDYPWTEVVVEKGKVKSTETASNN